MEKPLIKLIVISTDSEKISHDYDMVYFLSMYESICTDDNTDAINKLYEGMEKDIITLNEGNRHSFYHLENGIHAEQRRLCDTSGKTIVTFQIQHIRYVDYKSENNVTDDKGTGQGI